MAPAVSSSSRRVLAATATVFPGRAKASAMARPMPRPPPVTRIVTPLVLAPVAGVLVEERERLVGLHAIDEEHAVQMVGLVLNDPRREIMGMQLDAVARAIV